LHFFQAIGFIARIELPDYPFMTTPVGVSATSIFIASASEENNTRIRIHMQL